MRPLSYQQRLFVEYFLGKSSGSAADAARRAGYRWPEKAGPRLAKASGVRAAIDARVDKAAITASEILSRLADIATPDLLKLVEVNDDGTWKVDLKQIKRLGLGHLIKRLRKNKDGTPEIELEPKVLALVKLGEHFRLWKPEADEQITLVDAAKELEARYERIKARECGNDTGGLSEPTGPVQ